MHHTEAEHARAIDQLTFELQASQASVMDLEGECGKLRSQSKQLMESLNAEKVRQNFTSVNQSNLVLS